MSSNPDRLRVVVATPLAEPLCQLIEKREPRVELIRDQSLYPPMRHPADFTGDPDFSRTPDQQRAFEQMLDSADALYGIPDVDPAALTCPPPPAAMVCTHRSPGLASTVRFKAAGSTSGMP